jgi:hypothetical protein
MMMDIDVGSMQQCVGLRSRVSPGLRVVRTWSCAARATLDSVGKGNRSKTTQ